VREHTLITWDWPFSADRLPLPAGPGLGIELDQPALRRYVRAEAAFN
jgi:L-alanine-DL-glutamate epimerase-like enolase superfamily enzyme